jgi:hypothetical protein
VEGRVEIVEMCMRKAFLAPVQGAQRRVDQWKGIRRCEPDRR